MTSPDYYLLDELLTDETRAVRDRVRAFVDSDLLPVINDYWDRAEFPWPLVPKLAGLGLAGYTIEGYGCPGLTPLELGMVTLELARGDGSITTFMSVQSGLTMGTINLLGSEEQKQRWLPGMAALDKIGAFALTEPNHGSDSVALETTVRRDGDSWVLNGAKRWIGNASIADVDRGVGPRRRRRPGQGDRRREERRRQLPRRLHRQADHRQDRQTGRVAARCHPQQCSCAAGQQARRSRSPSATPPACWPRRAAARPGSRSGTSVAAYDIALEYAKNRIQFGKPIASFQLVQAKLAEMLAEITGMQLYCFRMAQLQEQGRWTGQMASLAKLNHARKGRQICLDARDILGGNGLLLENHIARHLTDMEVVHTYEGTDNIQSLLIGRDITGISAIN